MRRSKESEVHSNQWIQSILPTESGHPLAQTGIITTKILPMYHKSVIVCQIYSPGQYA